MSSGGMFDHYYEGSLPVNLAKWRKEYSPRESLIYREEGISQVYFVDDVIRDLFRAESKRYEKCFIDVISTHCSKSVTLPVYRILYEKKGKKLELTMRDNFYDWNVSVDSDFSLEGLFSKELGLFDTESTSGCYYQGFPSDKIHGCYMANANHFTACIDSKYDLYAFLYFIKTRTI